MKLLKIGVLFVAVIRSLPSEPTADRNALESVPKDSTGSSQPSNTGGHVIHIHNNINPNMSQKSDSPMTVGINDQYRAQDGYYGQPYPPQNNYGPPQGYYGQPYPPQNNYGPPQGYYGQPYPPQNGYDPQQGYYGQPSQPHNNYGPQQGYYGQPYPTQNKYGPQQGQYPQPQYQNNGYPQGQYQNNRYPQGQYQNNGYPQGQYPPPQNQYNEYPQGQYPPPQNQHNGYPQDQYQPPQNQYNGYQPSQYPPPQYRNNGYSQGQYQNNGYPQGQYQINRYPQGQYQNNGHPQGQYPPPQYPNPQPANYGQPPYNPYPSPPQPIYGQPPYNPYPNSPQPNYGNPPSDSGYNHSPSYHSQPPQIDPPPNSPPTSPNHSQYPPQNLPTPANYSPPPSPNHGQYPHVPPVNYSPPTYRNHIPPDNSPAPPPYPPVPNFNNGQIPPSQPQSTQPTHPQSPPSHPQSPPAHPQTPPPSINSPSSNNPSSQVLNTALTPPTTQPPSYGWVHTPEIADSSAAQTQGGYKIHGTSEHQGGQQRSKRQVDGSSNGSIDSSKRGKNKIIGNGQIENHMGTQGNVEHEEGTVVRPEDAQDTQDFDDISNGDNLDLVDNHEQPKDAHLGKQRATSILPDDTHIRHPTQGQHQASTPDPNKSRQEDTPQYGVTHQLFTPKAVIDSYQSQSGSSSTLRDQTKQVQSSPIKSINDSRIPSFSHESRGTQSSSSSTQGVLDGNEVGKKLVPISVPDQSFISTGIQHHGSNLGQGQDEPQVSDHDDTEGQSQANLHNQPQEYHQDQGDANLHGQSQDGNEGHLQANPHGQSQDTYKGQTYPQDQTNLQLPPQDNTHSTNPTQINDEVQLPETGHPSKVEDVNRVNVYEASHQGFSQGLNGSEDDHNQSGLLPTNILDPSSVHHDSSTENLGGQNDQPTISAPSEANLSDNNLSLPSNSQHEVTSFDSPHSGNIPQ